MELVMRAPTPEDDVIGRTIAGLVPEGPFLQMGGARRVRPARLRARRLRLERRQVDHSRTLDGRDSA